MTAINNKNNLIIRNSTPSDFYNIVELIFKVMGVRAPEQWMRLIHWRYLDNPAPKERLPMFLVGEVNSKIIGSQGFVPSRMKIGDKIVNMTYYTDLVVDPSARSKGYGKKIRKRVFDKEISSFIVSTSSNKIANKLTRSLGGKEVLAACKTYIRPLRSSKFIDVHTKDKSGLVRIVVNGFVSRIAGKIIDWLIWIWCFFMSLFESKVSHAQIENIKSFDNRFDRLWSKVSEDYPVLFVRDSIYLNWRYTDYPFDNIESFCLVRNKDIYGFAVIQSGTDGHGRKYVAILELFTNKANNGAFNCLMDEIIHRARKKKCDYIEAINSVSGWDRPYRNHGFIVNNTGFSPYTFVNNTDFSSSFLEDSNNWFISFGDGDICF